MGVTIAQYGNVPDYIVSWSGQIFRDEKFNPRSYFSLPAPPWMIVERAYILISHWYILCAQMFLKHVFQVTETEPLCQRTDMTWHQLESTSRDPIVCIHSLFLG
jgi:hypothetical protein